MTKTVFVFGSNKQGRHGAGAAYHALRYCGARWGQAEGLQGDSYGIVTLELRRGFPEVSLADIAAGVRKFLDFARDNPDLVFELTPIGCGLAGFAVKDIAPLFQNAPTNVELPEVFRKELVGA